MNILLTLIDKKTIVQNYKKTMVICHPLLRKKENQ